MLMRMMLERYMINAADTIVNLFCENWMSTADRTGKNSISKGIDTFFC